MTDFDTPGPPTQRPIAPTDPGADGIVKRYHWLQALFPILFVLAAVGSLAWWLTGRTRPQPEAVTPMKVPFSIATAHTVPIYRSFPAMTQAVRSVPIQARVTGYLTEQDAPDGAFVAASELLYRIDAKDYQVAFAQARATLTQTNAGLDYTRATNGRNQALARAGWTSRDTADQTQSSQHQGEASRVSNTAALQEAALNLSRTEIRAPFAGRLSASQVFTGSLISVAGVTLNTLVQLDPIYVSFNPAESNLGAITRQQRHSAIETTVTQDGSETSHHGPLTFIDNQVSLVTGTILLRATIANPDHMLLPGMFVTARLHLGDLTNALTVPQNVVGSTQIGRTLMIISANDKVEQRVVELGDSVGATVVVAKGLRPGERVITGQLQRLKSGAEVQPVATGSP